MSGGIFFCSQRDIKPSRPGRTEKLAKQAAPRQHRSVGRGGDDSSGTSALRGSPSSAGGFLPQHPEAREYYQALEKKHFSEAAVGSRFTEDISLQELVERLPEVDASRPLSEQDDRAYFQAQGIGGFKKDLGYFRVPAEGLSRLVPDSGLPPDEPIEVREVKPGFLSFITRAVREVPESEATLIVGRNPRGDTPFQVVTAFPGLPWEPERSGISVDEAKEKGISPGQTTLRELQALVGQDLLLQSR